MRIELIKQKSIEFVNIELAVYNMVSSDIDINEKLTGHAILTKPWVTLIKFMCLVRVPQLVS